MSKFYELAMSKEVSKHPSIKETHGFLGCFKRAIYSPTSSIVESFSNYYKECDAKLIKKLIDGKDDEIDRNLEALSGIDCTKDASFRLDLCISHDSQFIAMQLNHEANGTLTHITPIRYFEGAMAQKVEDIF